MDKCAAKKTIPIYCYIITYMTLYVCHVQFSSRHIIRHALNVLCRYIFHDATCFMMLHVFLCQCMFCDASLIEVLFCDTNLCSVMLYSFLSVCLPVVVLKNRFNVTYLMQTSRKRRLPQLVLMLQIKFL
jgi:hypothetical protein